MRTDLSRATWALRRASTLASRSLYSTPVSQNTNTLRLRKPKTRPWGSSVISFAATWPRRSLVACTLELKPFANLLADWPRLIEARLDWMFFQFSILLWMTILRLCLRTTSAVALCLATGGEEPSGPGRVHDFLFTLRLALYVARIMFLTSPWIGI